MLFSLQWINPFNKFNGHLLYSQYYTHYIPAHQALDRSSRKDDTVEQP